MRTVDISVCSVPVRESVQKVFYVTGRESSMCWIYKISMWKIHGNRIAWNVEPRGVRKKRACMLKAYCSENEHDNDVICELEIWKSILTFFRQTKTTEINPICDGHVFVFAKIVFGQCESSLVRWKKGGAIVGANQQWVLNSGSGSYSS